MKKKFAITKFSAFAITMFMLHWVSISTALGQTNIWDGSSSNNWNTPANWSLNLVPTAAHDVVININAAILVDITTTVNSLAVNGGAVVSLTSSGAGRTITIDNTGSSISAGSSLTLQGSTGSGIRSMSIAFTGANQTMSIAGTFNLTAVGEGTIYNATNSLTTVTGLFKNDGAGGGTIGTVTSSTTNLAFSSGGTYEHAVNAGTIPAATWNAASTCNITGLTNSEPGGSGQAFGNLTYNCPGMVGNRNMATTGLSVAGNFQVLNTGTGELRMSQATVNVGGNCTISDNFRIGSNIARTLAVTGNFTLNSGTLDMSSGNAIGTLNVGGHFSHTAGTLTETGTASGAILFNGTGIQIFTSGGTVSNTINYTVNNLATLQMADGSTAVAGNSFILSAGGTLGIRSPEGITTAACGTGATCGNIRTIVRTFNTAASYIYNGTAAQVTGNGLPATVNNLKIDNSAGIGLTNSVIVGNTLNMTTGNISCGVNTLELGTSTAAVGILSYTAGNIIGNFKRWAAASTASAIDFPVGTSANNHNARVTFTNNTGGSLTTRFDAGDPGGNSGFPLMENSLTIGATGQYTEGSWSIIPTGLTSTNYALELTGTGFTSGGTLGSTCRILKRPDAGGPWTLDGTHAPGSPPTAKRAGLNGFSRFALALPCTDPALVTPGGPDGVCQSETPGALLLEGASFGGSATTAAWTVTSLTPANGGDNGTLSSTDQTANPELVTYTPPAGYTGEIVLTLTTNDPAGDCEAATGTRTITVNALPSVALELIDDTGLVTETMLTLDGGTPAGGTYSGISVIGANFDPSVAGIGVHTITYTYTDGNGCTGTATDDVTVTAATATLVITSASETIEATCDQLFTVNIIATSGFTNLATLQYSINWDPNLSEYVSFSATNLLPDTLVVGDSNTSIGELIYSWSQTVNAGITLPDGTIIFSLTFRAIASSGAVSVNITGTPVPTEAFDYPLEMVTVMPANLVNIILIDNTLPAITCAPNQTQTADPDECSAAVTVAGPTIEDNCGVASVVNDFNNTADASGTYPVGTTDVTWTATDINNNTNTCVQTITVTDDQYPEIACPGNITVPADLGVCGAVVQYAPVTAGDNCPGETIEQTEGLTSGATYPVGTTTNTFEVTDASGNSTSCSFTVTVNDTEPPTIDCPDNITVNNITGTCGAVVQYDPVTADDNCPGESIEQTAGLTSGATYPVGITTNTFEVTDASGNSATCEFTVTVFDTEAPTIDCPDNITVNNDLGVCGAVVQFDPATTDDNCPGESIEQTAGLESGALFPVGTTANTFEATDNNGNTATCEFTITVIDNELPTIDCPDNITVSNTAGICEAIVEFVPVTANDNCPGETIEQTAGLTSGASYPVGITTNIFEVSDASGNSAACEFTVTVNDTEMPTIDCPDNITVNSIAGTCEAVVQYDPVTADDNCPGESIEQTAGLTSGATYPVGITTNTFEVTDASGNSATCEFTVTVYDTEAPTIDCPDNITVNNDLGICGAAVQYAPVTANDNCPDATIEQTAGLESGATFPVGTTTNIYLVTDAGGNTATCEFTVTVNDNEPPTIDCPDNITVSNDLGVCGAVVLYDVITDDNCPGESLDQTAGLVSGTTFPVGITANTFEVTDANGFTATCGFTVTVNDTEAPTIDCPGNITVNSTAGTCEAVVQYDPVTAGDNCPGVSFEQIAGLSSGATFPAGVTTNTFEATDAAGNTVTCQFTVTVTDNEDPVALCQNITVQLDADGVVSILAEDINNGSSDACGIATLTATPNSFNCQDIGANSVTLTVTDNNGNTSTCLSIVTVEDALAPVVVSTDAPNNPDINNYQCGDTFDNFTTDPGECIVKITIASPVWEDNCDNHVDEDHYTDNGTSLSGNGVFTFGDFPAGTTTVTFTGTDNVGNTGYCTITIIVTDNQLPTLTGCPASQSVNTTPGLCSATVNLVTPSAGDNCAIISTTYTVTGATMLSGEGFLTSPVFNVGMNTVTYVVTDAGGNTAFCTFIITVVDNQVPVITCPSAISVPNTTGTCGAEVTFMVTATDNCAATVTSLPTPGSTFPVGQTIVSATATDASGNTATCTFTVTVNDTEAPVITCPALPIVVSTDLNQCNAHVQYTVMTTDNCPPAPVLNYGGHEPGSIFPVGTTIFTVTASDATGNTSTCSITVTVNDTQLPTILCPPNITITANNEGCTAAHVMLDAPVASDNCTFTITNDAPTLFPSIPTPTTVTFTITDASLNIATCTTTVTVIPAVVSATITTVTPGTICVGGMAVVSIDVIATGDWTLVLTDGNPFTITGSGTMTASATVSYPNAGSYNITIVSLDDETDCPATLNGQATLEVVKIPQLTITPETGTVCTGGDVTFSATLTGGSGCTISWESSPDNTTWAPTGNTGTIFSATNLTTTTYYRAVTSCTGSGCGGDTSAVTLITVVPDPVVTISGPVNTCAGSTVTLAATLTGGAGCTVSWETSPDGMNWIPANITGLTFLSGILPAGIIYFRALVNCTGSGCSGAPSNVLAVNAANITANISGIQFICEGQSTNLAIVITGSNAGPFTVEYTANNVAQTPVVLPNSTGVISVMPTINTTYKLTKVTDAVGCMATGPALTGMASVGVNPPATVNAGDDQTICTGPNALLNGSIGGAATSAVWTTNGTGTFQPNAATLNATYIPSAADILAGAVTLTLTTNDPVGPCAPVSDQMVITITPPYVATLALGANAPQVICLGESTTLVLSFGNSSTGPWNVVYEINDVPFTLTATTNPYTFNVSPQFNAVIELISATTTPEGCIATIGAPNSIFILVNPVPIFTAFIENVNCFEGFDGSIDLTVENEMQVAVLQFEWSNGATTEDVSGLIAGTYTVTVTAGNGCTTTAVFAISEPSQLVAESVVVDNICESDTAGAIDLTVSGGTPGYTFLWSTGATSEDLNGLGSGTYTVTITDANGCTLIHSATVDFIDQQPPVITVEPAEITINCDEQVPDTGVMATDDVDLDPTITFSDDTSFTGICVHNYTITRTYSATDDCGRTATATRVVHVEDNTPPMLTVPADITIYADADCEYNADTSITGAPVVSDNCSTTLILEYVDDVVPGQCNGAHIINRIWTVTDECENSTNGIQVIMVQDTTRPTFIVPSGITIFTDINCQFSTDTMLTGYPAIIHDNCTTEPAVTFTDATVTGNCAGAFTITRTWKVTDDCGNTSTQIQLLNISDNLPPAFTVPGDMTVYTDADCAYNADTAVTGVPIEVADNCTAAPEVTYADTVTDGPCEGAHTITRIWTVTDNCSNSTIGIQLITILDDTDPTFIVPANITIYTDADCEYDASLSITGEPDAVEDNCTAAPVVTFDDDIQDGQCEGSHIITRTWFVTDDCGNTAVQTQIITVLDDTDPTFTVPSDVTISTDAACGYNADPSETGEPGDVQDNCTTDQVVNYTDVVVNGNCTGAKTITRTWTAIDDCGNAVSHTQVITVVDDTPPTFDIPADITVFTDINCEYNADPTETGFPSALHDNCATTILVDYADVINDGPCEGSQVITRTWMVKDGCNNITTGVQIITVTDNISPTFTVPESITIYTDADCNYNADPMITGQPGDASDFCSAAPVVTYEDDEAPGQCEGSLIITRTWTVTDDCGNATNGIQIITVEDNTDPTFTVPADITIETNFDCAYDANPIITGEPLADDNCAVEPDISYVDDFEEGQCEGSGTITRTWTVSDACGNATTQVQIITVVDQTPPLLILIEGDTADVSADYANIPPPAILVATDNCTTAVGLVYNQGQDNGPCAAQYNVTRTWTATDCAGNTTQVVQVITVNFTLTPGTIAANQSICTGAIPAPLTSTNAGSGYNTTTYRWEVKTDLNGTWSTIPGATGPTYTPGALTDTTFYRRFLVVTLPGNTICESVPSNVVAIIVSPATPVSVLITSLDLEVCSGESITFLATVTNGGVNPTYIWKKNGVTVATLTGTNLYTTGALVFPGDDNAVFTVEIIPGNDVTCPSPVPAISNGLEVQIIEVVLPVLTLSANQTLICPGETVNFTLMVTNAAFNSSLIIWEVNSMVVAQGIGLSTYSSSSLPNGAMVKATIIPLLHPCPAQATVMSNIIIITHKPLAVPSVSITASANPICPGGSVIFTATPVNGGISPSYQWMKNNITVGTNSPTYTDGNLQNGDVITVILTPSAEICPVPLTATATPVTITLYPSPVVTITGLASAYCQNAAAVVLAGTPANGTFTIDGNAATQFNPAVLSIGAHLVQYTATDVNGCSGSTIQTVVVQQLIVANAGPDQTAGSPTFTMAANTAAPGMGMWTVVSGNVTISNPSSPTTTVTITSGTGAVLRWTITNGACVTFDDVMISLTGIKVQLRAFLQGAYAPDLGKMRDILRMANLVPTTSPYGTGHTTTAAVLAVTGDNAIVDWVKVEIRDAMDHTLILATTSALIQRDGDVVAMDGVSTVPFTSILPGNYFVAIKHRNHLGILTANAIALTLTPPLYDFTLSVTSAFTDPMYMNAPMALMTGKYCMWGGDVNGDAIVRYTGPSNDNTALLQGCLGGNPALVISNVYSNCDLNMNGNIRYSGPSNDNSFLLQTVLGGNSALILFQHF